MPADIAAELYHVEELEVGGDRDLNETAIRSAGQRAKRPRGQDVIGGLTSKAVMSEQSAIPQTTTAGPVPSPAMGYPETTVRDLKGRKALNASFAADQVHGTVGGSRRR
jgi:hypothetical protein